MGIYGAHAEMKQAISSKNAPIENKMNAAINAYWYHGVQYYC